MRARSRRRWCRPARGPRTPRPAGGRHSRSSRRSSRRASTRDPAGESIRFPITFDPWYRWLSTILGLPPSSAYVQVTGEHVEVRMGWAFRSHFRRSDVSSATAMDIRPISRGVHGYGGRWLVNGAGRGILRIELSPAQRAYVMGLPIRVRELLVSAGDVSALAAALDAHGRR